MTAELSKIFPDWLDVSRETSERLAAFAALVQKWSAAINLVSKADLAQLWDRHILDSAQLFDLSPPEAASWADLGSGAGFPGIVIAILARQHRPKLQIHLIDSDLRKATFLGEAARRLDLTLQVHRCRIDSLAPLGADVVSARALAPMPVLCGLAQRHLAPTGVALFLKGANVAPELDACEGAWQMDAALLPSRTNGGGTIVKIRGLQHV